MSRIGEEIHWELHQLGEGEELVHDSDRLGLTYRIGRIGDVPGSLYSGQRVLVWSGSQARGLTPVMERMHMGDSATIIMPSVKVPWEMLAGSSFKPPLDTTQIRIDLRIDLIMNAAQAKRTEEHMLLWSKHREEDEAQELVNFLKEKQLDSTHYFVGVFYVEERKGQGSQLRMGDMVTIDYSAYFLNGTIFDDTRASGSSLSFRIGDPDQVIKGLEIGLQAMRPGSTGTLIIPSDLAFGYRGSTTGIVPPFTTVIYDVEVVNVQHGRAQDTEHTNYSAPIP